MSLVRVYEVALAIVAVALVVADFYRVLVLL